MNHSPAFRLLGIASLGALIAVPALAQDTSHYYGGVSVGQSKTEVDANGRPIEGQKTWSVQTHREFPYAASVWVRLRRGRRPL